MTKHYPYSIRTGITLRRIFSSLVLLILLTVSFQRVQAQCTSPQYVENGGYSAGSQVQNAGNRYECKPWPYSGWCNGSAWAYAPGTGSYWTDAWTLVGPCTVTNAPPAVSITSPANNATFTAPASITINANASDSDGTVTSVAFYNGTTLLGSDNTLPYSFSWTNVAVGTYSITARATDNSGATTTSTAISVKVNVPSNQTPTVSITSPANGASFTAPSSVTIDATANDSDGTIASVAFYNGTTLLGSDNTLPYSFVWNNVAAGTYSITARVTDNQGAVGNSTAISINVTNPVITVATLYKHCNYATNGYGIALPAGNYTTAQLTAQGISNNDISSIRVNSGYEVVLYDADNFAGTPVIIRSDVSCLTANSFNDLTSSFRIRTITSNQVPSVNISSPANNTAFTAPASITINANASDTDGTISSVEFFHGTTSLGIDNTSPYSVTWNNVAAGTYQLTAKATDNGGASTTSSVITIVVSNPSLVDITNLGGLMTAQHGDSPSNEGIMKLIDNSSSTKFLTFNSAAWVQLQQANASVITKYTLTSANDAADRDPLNWTLQGSNNGESWTTLDTRSNEDFPTRLLKKEYTFTNSTSYTYYRLQMTNNAGTILQLAELELWGTGGGGDVIPTPPATWQEHWFDHTQLISRVFYNDQVAVYFDNDMNRNITWMNTYLTQAWVYTKQVYGDLNIGGSPDKRLYGIFHQDKYGGGHPSYHYDGSHDYRNVIDLGSSSWTTPTGWALDATIHEIGHIVESTTFGTQGSPCFSLWGDSKWCVIYQYDLYLGVGWNADAQRWYNSSINSADNFPRANTYWFRDWFYPVWNNHGKSAVLGKFFQLMSQYFPKNGARYTRDMNWGEFIHFWSGAAGVNLKSQATIAFGWPAEWESQFRQAQIDFPFTYSNFNSKTDQTLDNTATDESAFSTWNSADGQTLTVNLPEGSSGDAEVILYSSTGSTSVQTPAVVSNNMTTINISGVQPGIYVLLVDCAGRTYKKTVMISY